MHEDEVREDELVWRRFSPEDITIEADGARRPSSVAFLSRDSNGVSVHRARLIDLATVASLTLIRQSRK